MKKNPFIGVPYKKHGRDAAGWDCLGLVLAVWKSFGIDSRDPLTDSAYPEDENFEVAAPKFRDLLERVDDVPKHLDVILLCNEEHVAVMWDDTQLMHVSEKFKTHLIPVSRVKHLIKAVYRRPKEATQ